MNTEAALADFRAAVREADGLPYDVLFDREESDPDDLT